MRRILLAGASTVAALVLLFSYRTSLGDTGSDTGQAATSAHIVTSSAAAPASSAATASAGSGPDPSTGASNPSSTASAATTITVDGASEDTRYGPVQVELVITNGTITDVVALAYPQTERRDQQINSRAIPLLRNQVLDAQSARVAGV